MITFIRNIFIIPELRKRIIFTLLLLAVYRIGSQIVTPGINVKALQELKAGAGNNTTEKRRAEANRGVGHEDINKGENSPENAIRQKF